MERGRAETAAMVLLTVAAAAIRFPTLAQQSLWLDEAYTYRLIRMSFGGMLRAIPRTESTPPLYYVLAWVWTHVFGDSAYALRSISALAGVATVPVAYAAARRLAGPRAGRICAWLLCVSPLMVWFSQEARAYALATLFSALSVLCLIGWLRERRGVWLAGWAAAATLGLATHYFVVFVAVPELALLWWWGHGRWDRRLALACVPVAVVGAALIPLALAQRGTGHADYIANTSLAPRIAQVPKQLLIGYASPLQVVSGVVAGVLVLGAVVWPLVRNSAARRRALAPLVVGVACVVIPILLALAGIDFLDTRNLLPALPALWVAGAVALAAAAPVVWRRAALAGLTAVSLAIVIAVDVNPVYQRDNWRGAAAAVGSRPVPRAIVVSPASGLIPLQVYLPRLRPLAGRAVVREIDVIVIPEQVTGGGIGVPPRPAPLPVPPGFRLVRAVATRTYTDLVYRSPRPVVVTPAVLARDRLGTAPFTPLLEASPAPRVHR